MKRHLPLLHFLLCLLMLAALPSCEDIREYKAELQSPALRFSLSAAPFRGCGLPTRVAGNDAENRIDKSSLVVMLFDGAGMRKAVFTADHIHPDGTDYVVSECGDEIIDATKIVVLANWDSDVDWKNISTLDDLRRKEIAYNTTTDYSSTGIPMSGEAECSVGADGSLLLGEIEMVRALAKIEVNDRLEGSEILSATLTSCSPSINPFQNSGNTAAESDKREITFSHDKEAGQFYLYVPECELGDEDSDRRHILLNVQTSADGEPEEYSLWLKDYPSEEEQADESVQSDRNGAEADGNGLGAEGNEKYSWTNIERNHLYRFNVTSIETPTPPIPAISDKIRICWYPTRCGKFTKSVFGFCYYESVVKPTLLLKSKGQTAYKSYKAKMEEVDTKNTDRIVKYYVDVNLEESQFSIVELSYQIIDTGLSNEDGYVGEWSENRCGNLLEDVLRFEISEDRGTSILNLNSFPLAYSMTNSTYFPRGCKYRLYWRNPEIKLSSIRKDNASGDDEIPSSECSSGKDGNYIFTEFKLAESDLEWSKLIPNWKIENSYSYSYGLWPGHFTGSHLLTQDFSPMTVDGETVYVFFVD